MFCSIETAIKEFQQGQFLVLVDDEERENEGDLILAAQFVTPAKVHKMTREAGGMFMLTLSEAHMVHLGLELIEARNSSFDAPRFGVPFDARSGIGTGISARDRAVTVLRALEPGCGPEDIAIPGHVLPLAERPGGLAERRGHTEGSVGMARLAGLYPAALMSEILNSEGEMAKGDQLAAIARQIGCKIISVEQIARASV